MRLFRSSTFIEKNKEGGLFFCDFLLLCFGGFVFGYGWKMSDFETANTNASTNCGSYIRGRSAGSRHLTCISIVHRSPFWEAKRWGAKRRIFNIEAAWDEGLQHTYSRGYSDTKEE